MIRYILLNPGDVISEHDEMLYLLDSHLCWHPATHRVIGKSLLGSENPCRRPLSRAGLLKLAEEAAHENRTPVDR